jgi:AcrR family transcriptional regulator
MSEPVKGRSYHSPLREEQTRATRRRVVRAAQDLFLEQGYGATTIAEVARRAGVSVDTVYTAFGTKRGLLDRVLDVNVGGDDRPVAVLDREEPQRMRAETDQRRQLAMFATGMAGELERMRPLDDVLRSAAAADPEVAAARDDQNVRQRHATMATVLGWVRQHGPLRAGLDDSAAADIVWTLTSPEVHYLLCRTRGWTRSRYEEWLRDTLVRTLLPDQTSRDLS